MTDPAYGIQHYTGTKAASGDNSLIAAPGAGRALKLHAVTVQLEAATATTIILKNGTTAFRRFLAQAQGNHSTWEFAGNTGLLAENAALVANLSGANSCGFSVIYEEVLV